MPPRARRPIKQPFNNISEKVSGKRVKSPVKKLIHMATVKMTKEKKSLVAFTVSGFNEKSITIKQIDIRIMRRKSIDIRSLLNDAALTICAS